MENLNAAKAALLHTHLPNPLLQFRIAICPVPCDLEDPLTPGICAIPHAMQLFTSPIGQVEFGVVQLGVADHQIQRECAWDGICSEELLK